MYCGKMYSHHLFSYGGLPFNKVAFTLNETTLKYINVGRYFFVAV